jgi:hypothetical protein
MALLIESKELYLTKNDNSYIIFDKDCILPDLEHSTLDLHKIHDVKIYVQSGNSEIKIEYSDYNYVFNKVKLLGNGNYKSTYPLETVHYEYVIDYEYQHFLCGIIPTKLKKIKIPKTGVIRLNKDIKRKELTTSNWQLFIEDSNHKLTNGIKN